MVLGEVIDKTEQKSDWSAPELSEQQITYALNDAVITARIFNALSDEMRAKSKLHGVDIASGYEDLRYSAAMARDMEHAGVGFDAAAHAAWVSAQGGGHDRDRRTSPPTRSDAHAGLHRVRRPARRLVQCPPCRL